MSEEQKAIEERLRALMLKHLRTHHGPKTVTAAMLEEGLGTLSEHGNDYHSPDFLPKNGSQAATGDIPMGSHKITGLAAPTASGDAARKDETDACIAKSLLTTRGDMIRRSASAPERFAKGASGKFLKAGANDPDWQWDEAAIEFTIDGGGSAISTGVAGGLEVPFDCFVTGWTIGATDGNTGSIVVDVWKDTYGNFPPTVADTIAESEKPTISASNKGQDLSLSTWTQALSQGDWLFFNVDSCSTLTRVTLSLRVDKYRSS